MVQSSCCWLLACQLSLSMCSSLQLVGRERKKRRPEKVNPCPKRLYLEEIDASLKMVERHWREIDDELALRGIGRKEPPFTTTVRIRMMRSYSYMVEML